MLHKTEDERTRISSLQSRIADSAELENGSDLHFAVRSPRFLPHFLAFSFSHFLFFLLTAFLCVLSFHYSPCQAQELNPPVEKPVNPDQILRDQVRDLTAKISDPRLILLSSASGIAEVDPLEDNPVDLFADGVMSDWTIARHPENVDGCYIVQFNGVIRRQDREGLWGLGAEIIGYAPNNAYVVRMSSEELGRVRDLPQIRWIGVFQPVYKVAPRLAEMMSSPPIPNVVRLRVSTFRGKSVEDILEDIIAADPSVTIISALDSVAQRGRVIFDVDGSALVKTARLCGMLTEVEGIEVEWGYRLENDTARWVLQSGDPATLSTPVHDNGITGIGQIYAGIDTGIDVDACQMRLDSTDSAITIGNSTAPPFVNITDPGKKILSYYIMPTAAAYDDTSVHGTHTVGNAVGDNFANLAGLTDAGVDIGDGMAPGARIIFQDVGDASGGLGPLSMITITDLHQQAYDSGARSHNSSYGLTVSDVSYGSDSRDADEVMWRLRDYNIVFSAGNSGPLRQTLTGISKLGKSVLTIGATDTRAINPFTTGATEEDATDFSSRGPTSDLRIKPDLMAPGIANSANETSFSGGLTTSAPPNNNDNCLTSFDPGTSFSAPLAAGMSLLARQYFTDGYYPSGVRTRDPLVDDPLPPLPQRLGEGDAFNPSNALVRAVLINSCRNMTGAYTAENAPNGESAPRPNSGQGWGRVTLDDALAFPADQRKLLVMNDVLNGANSVDPPAATAAITTGETHSFVIQGVTNTEDLKITLCWSDKEGALLAAVALVNDLDLVVTDPDGTVYKGNMNFQNAFSKPAVVQDPNDPTDRDNRHAKENVFIEAPDIVPGDYTVDVIGRNVPGDGTATPFDSARQGYALIATGDFIVPTAPPRLTKVSPGASFQGATNVDITIKGANTNFVSEPPVVSFSNPGIVVNGVTVLNDRTVVANIDVSLNAQLGIGDVSVQNPSLGVLTLRGSFTIMLPLGEKLNQNDDDFNRVELFDPLTQTGFTFPFYGKDYSEFFVNSNGSVTFLDGSFESEENLSSFWGPLPRIAPFFDDLNPGADIGSALSLFDDDFIQINFSQGFTFPYFGQTYTSIYVNSNGNLTFGAGDWWPWPSIPGGVVDGLARISPFFTDLNPGAGGDVFVKQLPDRLIVTWQDVPLFPATSVNSFQVTLMDDGRILFDYNGITARGQPPNTISVAVSPGGAPTVMTVNYDLGVPFSSLDANTAIFENFNVNAVNAFDLDGKIIQFAPNAGGGFDVDEVDKLPPVPGDVIDSYVNKLSDRVIVTYFEVPEAPKSGRNSAQVILYGSNSSQPGAVEIVYYEVTLKDSIVGVTPGGAFPQLSPVDFTEIPIIGKVGAIFEQFIPNANPFDLRTKRLLFVPNSLGSFDLLPAQDATGPVVVSTSPADLEAVQTLSALIVDLEDDLGVDMTASTALVTRDDIALVEGQDFTIGRAVPNQMTIRILPASQRDGKYVFTILPVDNSGNGSSATITVFDDSRPPEFVEAIPPSDGGETVLSTIELFFADNVDVDEPGTMVSIQKDGRPFTSFQRDDSVDGKVVLTIPAPSDGIYTLTIVPRDTAGNNGETSVINITDGGALPIFTSSNPVSGSIVQGLASLTIFTADDVDVLEDLTADTVRVLRNGVPLARGVGFDTRTKLNDPSVPEDVVIVDLLAPSDALYEFFVTPVDNELNRAAIESRVAVTVDSLPPELVSADPPDGAVISPFTTMTLTFTDNNDFDEGATAATVTIKRDGAIFSNFDVDDTKPNELAINITNPAQGVYAITFTPIDVAGNVGAVKTIFVADSTTLPIFDGSTPPDGTITQNLSTLLIRLIDQNPNDGVGVVTNTTVSATRNGEVFTGFSRQDDLTQNTITLTLFLSTDAEYVFAVTPTDDNGAASPTSFIGIVVDNEIPSLASPADGSTTFLQDFVSFPFRLEDNRGVDAAATGASIAVSRDGVPLASPNDFDFEVTGSDEVTVNILRPQDGDYEVSLTPTDIAGNVAPTATVHIVDDSVRPTLAGTNPEDGEAVDRMTTMTVSASDNTELDLGASAVIVKRNGVALTEGVEFLRSNLAQSPTGDIVISFLPPILDGDYVFDVTIADAAGNKSDTATFEVTDNAVPPSVSDTTPSNGSATNNFDDGLRIEFAGEADIDKDKNDTLISVIRTVNGNQTQLQEDAPGGFTRDVSGPANEITVKMSDPVLEGEYSIDVKPKDVEGRAGSPSRTTIVFDAQPPFFNIPQQPDLTEDSTGPFRVTVLVGDNGQAGLAGKTPKISFHRGANEDFSPFQDMSPAGDPDTWFFDIPEPAEGWQSIGGDFVGYRFEVSDRADNVGTSPEQNELVDGINDPPEILPIPGLAFNEDNVDANGVPQGDFRFNLSAYETDSDNTPAELTWEVDPVDTPVFTAAIEISNGDDFLVLTPKENQSGVALLTLTLRDIDGLADTQVVLVSVIPFNDAPEIAPAVADIQIANPGAAFTMSLTDNENDVEDGDAQLTWHASNFDRRLVNATVDRNDTLIIVALPQPGVPPAKVIGATALTLTLTDSGGKSASQNITVTLGAAPPPTVIGTTLADVTLNVPITAPGLALPIVGGEPPLNWALVGGQLPDGVALTQKGRLEGIPLSAAGAPFIFNVRATDASVPPRISDASFTVNVRLFDAITGRQWREIPTGSATGAGLISAGSGSGENAVAVADAIGNIFVAWQAPATANRQIYARQLKNGVWIDVGAGSSSGGGVSDTPGDSVNPTIAIANNLPVIAWEESAGNASDIFLLAFDGNTWKEIGNSASAGGVSGTGTAHDPALAVDSAGTIFLAWTDLDTVGGDAEIFVKQYNARTQTEFVEVVPGSASGGGVSDDAQDSSNPALAVSSLFVAWQNSDGVDNEIYVKKLSGNDFVEVAPGSASGGGVSDNIGNSINPSIATDKNGAPGVAWADNTSGNYEIFFKAFDGAQFSEIPNGSASGAGISDNPTDSTNPFLMRDSAGDFVAVWQNEVDAVSQIYARRLVITGADPATDSAWVPIGREGASNAGLSDTLGRSAAPSIADLKTGDPVVLWHDFSGGANPEVYAKYLPNVDGDLRSKDTFRNVIDFEGDVDSVTFSGTAGTKISASLSTVFGPDLLPTLRVFRPDGSEVAGLTIKKKVGSLKLKNLTLDQDGVHRFDISADGGWGSTFDLVFKPRPRKVKVSASGAIGGPGFVGVHRFVAGKDTEAKIQVKAGKGGLDPVATLFAPSGKVVARDDDGASPKKLDSLIVADLDETGPYILVVSGYGQSAGPYKATVTVKPLKRVGTMVAEPR